MKMIFCCAFPRCRHRILGDTCRQHMVTAVSVKGSLTVQDASSNCRCGHCMTCGGVTLHAQAISVDVLFWGCRRTCGLCNKQLGVLAQAKGPRTTPGVGVKTTLCHRQSIWMHAGCKTPAEDAQIWSCYMRSPCGAGREAVLTGWSPDAPAAQLPEDVSFSVGAGTGLASVVLQVSVSCHTAPRSL